MAMHDGWSITEVCFLCNALRCVWGMMGLGSYVCTGDYKR